MKRFITNHMFMLNGLGSIEDKSAAIQTSIKLIESATSSGLFASDCLITWAKSLGFLEDPLFVSSFNGVLHNNPDNSWIGTAWRTHIMCWCAMHCLNIEGDFAEVGCYAGNTVKMVIDYSDFKNSSKTYWLYDMFENQGNVTQTLALHSETLYQSVIDKFKDYNNVKINKGIIPEVFDILGLPEKIAFLHIDLNNAASERQALERMYDRLSIGAIIIFDDYGWVQYRPQKDTIDEFFKKINKSVLELPTGQGLLIKS